MLRRSPSRASAMTWVSACAADSGDGASRRRSMAHIVRTRRISALARRRTETSFDGRLAMSLVRELGGTPGRGLGVGHVRRRERGSRAPPVHRPECHRVRLCARGDLGRSRRSRGASRSATDWRASTSSAPLFGFVHRPYADTRREREAPNFAFASPAALRAVNAGVSYETSERRRLGLFAAYRLRAMDLTEPQPLRTTHEHVLARHCRAFRHGGIDEHESHDRRRTRPRERRMQ